jgi:hypothetical protein
MACQPNRLGTGRARVRAFRVFREPTGACLVPGVDRRPLKKLEPHPAALQRLLEGWRAEGIKRGRPIERIPGVRERAQVLGELGGGIGALLAFSTLGGATRMAVNDAVTGRPHQGRFRPRLRVLSHRDMPWRRG